MATRIQHSPRITVSWKEGKRVVTVTCLLCGFRYTPRGDDLLAKAIKKNAEHKAKRD
jgi:hypothetical protein